MVDPSRTFIARKKAKAPFFVGMDLGGTTIKVGVVDDRGAPLCLLIEPTQVANGPEEASRRMGGLVGKAIEKVGLEMSDVVAVGLGCPGTLDFRAGVMITPTNFPGWGGFPIRDRLAEHCGLPVTLANDASAAAYGEFWIGVGKSYHSLILLTLGTGVGCGVIIGDLIIEGENGHGTECGHIIIDPADDARVCSCGQTGHLESYASATGVIHRTQEALALRRPSTISARLEAGAGLTPLLVAEEAETGDPLAIEIVMDTAKYLAMGIVTLMHTIDPTGVLIGGSMTFGKNESPLGRSFIERIRQEVRCRTFPMLAERMQIDYAVLGPDAGFIGAAGIARVDYCRNAQRDTHVANSRSTRRV
jgi:glucokinase